MHLKGKPMTGHMIIKKAKSLYDEMKITDERAFSEDSNKTGSVCINITWKRVRVTSVAMEKQ
jgi:hypothetical protein